MSETAIAPEMTLFAITEEFPETIDVFVANGYEHVGDEKKRTTNGKMVTLQQAVQMKGKDLRAFTALLENAVATNAKNEDVTLATVNDENQIFPTEGDIRVAGLLPCPVRIPLLEAFDNLSKKITAETGKTVGVRLAAASVGADALDAGMKSITDESDLPDIFLSAGFEAFFDRRNMARFIQEDLNPLLRGWSNYFQLTVFLVDKTQLDDGEEVPRTWKEILGPRFKNKIAMPVGDFDLFNGILLTIWKEFGDEGVAAIGRNLLEGMHPSQAAGRFAPKGGKGPMVSVIPYFFSKMAQFNADAEIVWLCYMGQRYFMKIELSSC